MTPEEVYQMLLGIDADIPVAYYQFLDSEPGPAPDPPFICYYYAGDDDLFADNINFVSIQELIIELYTDFKNFETEEKVESALRENELAWEKNETYIDNQRMHMTTWTTTILIKKEEV